MSVAVTLDCGQYDPRNENSPRVGSAEAAGMETYRHLPVCNKLGKRDCPQNAHPRAVTQGVCL
jgi:hypothetical protein